MTREITIIVFMALVLLSSIVLITSSVFCALRRLEVPRFEGDTY
jgi:hypothetical protein